VRAWSMPNTFNSTRRLYTCPERRNS